MRSFGLTTIVCLAVAVSASPTPIDSSALDARDAWTPPVRRDIFVKRSPLPEPEPEPQAEESVGKRSPFTFTLPNNLPISGTFGGITISPGTNGHGSTITFGNTTSSGGGRFPFFFKRDGKLEARDVEVIKARKEEIEKREQEIAARELEDIAQRELEELAKREAEDLARREAEELALREAQEVQAREAHSFSKRAVIEDIEAREAELEMAKREYEEMARREYEEMQQRELMQYGMRDLESREPLSFTLPKNMAVSGRRLPFDLRVTLEARDFDEAPTHLAKRAPQFNIASLISQLRGNTTAGGGTGTGTGTTSTNNAINRLNSLVNGRLSGLLGGNNAASAGLANIESALNRFGFNFRREEELARELSAREPAPFPFSFKEDTVSRRDPFDFDAFVKAKRWNN